MPNEAQTGQAAAQPAVPPNWYADPAGRHQYRYWDGTKWTGHVADNGVTAVDPVGSEAGASAAAEVAEQPAAEVAETAGAEPAAQTAPQTGPVRFDADGHVSDIAFPERGAWQREAGGQCTYYTLAADTLLEAAELLRKVEDIPGLTY